MFTTTPRPQYRNDYTRNCRFVKSTLTHECLCTAGSALQRLLVPAGVLRACGPRCSGAPCALAAAVTLLAMPVGRGLASPCRTPVCGLRASLLRPVIPCCGGIVETGQPAPLDPLPQHAFHAAHERLVLPHHERQRFARLVRAPRAPDAMRVGVHGVRHVKVDDM